jgi:hypothetical protein
VAGEGCARVKLDSIISLLIRVPNDKQTLTFHNTLQGPNTQPVVPLTYENYKKCMCPDCPVQSESNCVRNKLTMIVESHLRGWEKTGIPLNPQHLPALYCSTGSSSCKDIDSSRMCSCSGCPVYIKYNLREGVPLSHYCKDGCQVLCEK